MQTHFQSNKHYGFSPYIHGEPVEFHFGSRVVTCSKDLAIDQFFSQPHNLDHGNIDTSPANYDDPSFASHINPLGAESALPSDMSDDDIHSIVVSKHCQSKAEVSRLTGLKPNVLNDETPVENEPPSEPAQPSQPKSE